MQTTLEQKIQNGTYWTGAALGAMVMLLVVLVFDRLTASPDPSSIRMPRDVVEAYRMGVKDALKTNPPNAELEKVCLDLWSQRQPVKE
jgi:hypothetical protein